jgi:hypothetical protein
MTEQTTYYVPRISTKHGEDIAGVYESLDDAVAAVAAFCRDWWSDAQEEAGNRWEDAGEALLDEEGQLPMPDSDDEVIQLYFELVESEFYEVHQVPFYPTTVVH